MLDSNDYKRLSEIAVNTERTAVALEDLARTIKVLLDVAGDVVFRKVVLDYLELPQKEDKE